MSLASHKFVPMDITPVLCWSCDENRFAIVHVLTEELKRKEELLGTLVKSPGLVRALHVAFVRHMVEHGKPPDIVRCELSPTVEYAYVRVGLYTGKGNEASNLNAYFGRPRVFIAA